MRLLLRPTSIVFLAVFLAGLAWAVGTGQIWEDSYITFRASRNLAEGRGLTYNEGTRVHSFTSPLGVLLPAATYLLTGRSSDGTALWIYRLLGAAALATAATLLWLTLRKILVPAPAAALLVALLATDSKAIGFSVNGMETGFVLLFLSWSLWALFTRPVRPALHLGLAWGGLMWSRPDSCLYIAALGTGLLLFAPGEGNFWTARAAGCRRMLGAAGIATVVYLPWFAWAWWYYGSPVPHTIVAKGLFTDTSPGHLFLQLAKFPAMVIEGNSTLKATLLPYYEGWSGWSDWVGLAAFGVAVVPFVLFLFPQVRWEARVASFAYAAGHFYLSAVAGPWPWYIPTVTVLGLTAGTIALGQALEAVGHLHPAPAPATIESLRKIGWGAAGLLVAGSATITLLMGRQAFLETTIVARQVRGAIGLWLHENAKSPRETVFLEPLGYIGYFSGLRMLDYPGLASPEVVAARQHASSREYPACWAGLIRELQPDWLILRPFEERAIARNDPRVLAETYDRVMTFDATREIALTPWVPIRAFLEYDGTFALYRRRPPGTTAARISAGPKS